MALREQHPAQLLVMNQPPRSAAALPSGAFQGALVADYSSLFLGETMPDRSFVMDGEVLRAAAIARVGVGAGFDLELEVPVVHASGGFLDSFIVDYHDFFGLPQSGRDQFPEGQYDVRASRGGTIGYELTEHGIHLGDLPVRGHLEVLSESADRPGLAVRAGFELPTGSAAKGTGNGRWDASVGLASEWHLVGLGFTLGAFHSFTGGSDAATRAGFGLEDVTGLQAGVEWPVAPSCALLLQSTLATSTLRGLDLSRTEGPQWLLWLGTRLGLLPGLALELAFSEDLLPDISPDFSVRAALVLRTPGSPQPP